MSATTASLCGPQRGRPTLEKVQQPKRLKPKTTFNTDARTSKMAPRTSVIGQKRIQEIANRLAKTSIKCKRMEVNPDWLAVEEYWLAPGDQQHDCSGRARRSRSDSRRQADEAEKDTRGRRRSGRSDDKNLFAEHHGCDPRINPGHHSAERRALRGEAAGLNAAAEVVIVAKDHTTSPRTTSCGVQTEGRGDEAESSSLELTLMMSRAAGAGEKMNPPSSVSFYPTSTQYTTPSHPLLLRSSAFKTTTSTSRAASYSRTTRPPAATSTVVPRVIEYLNKPVGDRGSKDVQSVFSSPRTVSRSCSRRGGEEIKVNPAPYAQRRVRFFFAPEVRGVHGAQPPELPQGQQGVDLKITDQAALLTRWYKAGTRNRREKSRKRRAEEEVDAHPDHEHRVTRGVEPVVDTSFLVPVQLAHRPREFVSWTAQRKERFRIL
ncbi:unnamed protein product [Amoebophrya sp. A120]|nr:unnamed protein product [Amoebophrya sp. A120]|eukprot:GSA120T00005855001.1